MCADMQRNQPERDGPEARRVDPLLEVRERKVGARPGDAYVRIVRPFEDEFERSDEGHADRVGEDDPGPARLARRGCAVCARS